MDDEFQVNTTSKGSQYFPSIASDSAGAFVIAWASSPSEGYSDVYARRFDDDGNPLGDEFRVNTFTTAQQRFADVAMNSDGFIVVWESDEQDGSQDGVYGQRYSANGIPNGSEFRVNTYTPYVQGFPHVSMSPEGSVVVWYGFQDEDSNIYAQLYDSAAHLWEGNSRSMSSRREAKEDPTSRWAPAETSWSSGAARFQAALSASSHEDSTR